MAAERTDVGEAPTGTPLCIYCSSPLAESTRAAHAVPAFLGGRKRSRRTECSQCNEYFGPLEERVGEALRPVSAALGAVTADGDRIVATLYVPERGRVRIWGGIAERELPRPEIVEVDGKRIRYQKLPRDDGERARVMARALFDDGKTVDDLDNGKVEFLFDPWTTQTQRVDLGEFTIRLGGREQRRAFTKMAVSLLGCFDESAARSVYLDSARRFARIDRGDIEYWPESASLGSGLIPEGAAPAFAHGVEVWSCDGRLQAMLRFFGRFRFTAILASSWPRGAVCAAYAVDPLGKQLPIEKFAREDGRPLGLVHGRSVHDMIRSFDRWFEGERDRICALSKDDLTISSPDLEKLRPMIRQHLAKLWAKHRGGRNRGGRGRRSLS